MEHFIRTVYGDSKTGYGGAEWEKTPHGCGTGNGQGPSLWAGISSPLLTIMKRKGFGTKMESPILHDPFDIVALIFLNDTDMVEMSREQEDWNTLFGRTQKSLDMWECLIRTTGGALEPAKSDWVKIVHKWKYGTSYLAKADPSDILKMRDPNGETTALQQKEPTTARLLLGVWQSPVGDETKMKNTLKAAVEKWGQNITKSGMNKAEALTAAK